MLSLFILCQQPALILHEEHRVALTRLLAELPSGSGARIMLPDTTPAEQPFSQDGPGPALALQVTLPDLAVAGEALAATSPLARLPALLGVSAGAFSQQVMETHAFPFPAPPLPDPFCTFLVTYPGTTADLAGWLRHYDTHHPPIMKTFPRIREVETYWPLDVASALPFARDTAMQRNKVVFDSFADLLAALASPVMEAMRADGRGFPPSSARATHFPMRTWNLPGARASGT